MATIREFEQADLRAVEALLEAHMPGWQATAGFFRRTLVDDPWADPELPSLVAVGESEGIVGFLAAQPRRLRFRDDELRGLCASHLVVSPDDRAGATGALLLGRLLKGPQDLTWSDTSTDVVARMWHTYGGHVDHTRTLDWRVILRPGRWIRERATAFASARRHRRGGAPAAIAAPTAAPGRAGVTATLHDAAAVAAPRADDGAEAAADGRDATAAEIAEHLDAIGSDLSFRVDYDAHQLEHVFAMVRESSGELCARLVLARGRPLGWYAYLPVRRGVSRVLHVATRKPRDLDAVVGDLLADARRRDCTMLSGRVEPHLYDFLRSRSVLLGHARRPVFHAHDPELRATLATSGALLSRLDGEWFAP